MEYLGLLFELVLLATGIYIYLFSRGFFRVQDPVAQKRADDFRRKNATLLRLGGLALAAVMALNIVLHLLELFGR